MKKETKRQIIVLIIVLIFFSSTIAYVAINAFVPVEQERQELNEFIIQGELGQDIETDYLRRGFTILKFYYSSKDEKTEAFLNQVQDSFKVQDQVQLIIQLINHSYERDNRTFGNFMVITSANAERELVNATLNDIFDALCDVLLFPPVECGLRAIPKENTTGESNQT